MYRAVDQHGQVIDVLVSRGRDIAAARRFFLAVMTVYEEPVEVVTDRQGPLVIVGTLVLERRRRTGARPRPGIN